MSYFSEDTIRNIKDDIIKGLLYKDIQAKYNIKNDGLLRRINSGKYFFSDADTYPLFIKGSTKQANKQWVSTIQFQLQYCKEMSMSDIASQNGKSEVTVRKINLGWAHKKEELTYPLRKY